MLPNAIIKKLRFSRRLQECCFLLRHMWYLNKNKPLSDFWHNRAKEYTKLIEDPEFGKLILTDLNDICTLCEAPKTDETRYFVLASAFYGVIQTYRTAAIFYGENCKETSQEGFFRKIEQLELLVSYLYSYIVLNVPSHKIGYGIISKSIEKAYKSLHDRGYLEYSNEKAGKIIEALHYDGSVELVMPDSLYWFENQVKSIPALLETHSHNVFEDIPFVRDREIDRSYIFWCWRRRKMTLAQIADKWSTINDNKIITEQTVSKAINIYEKHSGSLFSQSFIKDVLSTPKPQFKAAELFANILKIVLSKERQWPYSKADDLEEALGYYRFRTG